MARSACGRRLLGLLLVALIAWPAVGGNVDTKAITDEDAQIAQLQAALDAQAQRLTTLRQQVAASQDETLGADRTEQMRVQIREVLSDAAFRESLMPATAQAGYQRGFYIRSTDDRFKLQVNGRIQFRWTHYATRSQNRYLAPGTTRSDRTGFDVPRIYFTFGGHAYTRDLTYALILDGSEYRTYDMGILHAWVNYRFVDEFQVRAGIMRVAGTRANVNTATMQFVETPLFDAVFAIPRGLGVRFWGRLFANQPIEGQYRLDIVNTLGTPNTRTITTDEDLYAAGHDNNPGIFFHTVWGLMRGCCTRQGDEVPYPFASCDWEYHTEPALNIGAHYAFTEDTHDGALSIPYARKTFFQPGGFGLTSSDGLQIQQFGLDLGFKYRGFSATAEYAVRVLDVRHARRAPFTPLYQLTGDDSTSTLHGGYLQCGYFLPIPGWEQKFEVVGRVEGMATTAGGREGTWAYAGGFNYYIDGHRVKLQTDVTKVTETPVSNSTVSLANVNDDALVWRMQLQFAF